MTTKNKKILFAISYYITIIYCIIYVIGIFTIPIAILLYIANNRIKKKYQNLENTHLGKDMLWLALITIFTLPFGVLVIIPFIHSNKEKG